MKRFGINVFRGIKKNTATFVGAILIIALGIFIAVSMLEIMLNLQLQIEDYYQKQNLADIFVRVNAIPEEKLKELEELEGIALADGILSAEVRLVREDMDSVVSVHLIGYQPGEKLNRIAFAQNNVFSEDTLYLGKKMFTVRNFVPGDTAGLILGGKVHTFVLAGSIFAPNYIYSMPPSGALTTDGADYDIAAMKKDRLEDLLGKRGVVNELAFSLEKSFSYDQIKDILRERLVPYGLISMTDRSDFTSYAMVREEIKSLVYTGTLIPGLFMLMSVFMLYVVLKKNIDQDRMLIGAMKAMGMKGYELMLAYVLEAILIGILGSTLGIYFAPWMGREQFARYADFFTLPTTNYRAFWDLRLGMCAAAIVICLVAVLVSVRDILKIKPAEAMRSAAPSANAGGNILKHVRLDVMTKMGLRSILRSKFRSVLIALAIGFPFGMALALNSFFPNIERILGIYSIAQKYDLGLALERFQTEKDVLASAVGIKGIESAEAIAKIPIRIKKGNRYKDVMLHGLHSGSDKYKIWADAGNKGYYVDTGQNGIIINDRIAKALSLTEGDMVWIDLVGFGITDRKVSVQKIITEVSGGGAYLSLEAFPYVLNIPSVSNMLLLNMQRGQDAQVKQQVLATSTVLSITDAKEIQKQYRNNFSNSKTLIQMFIFMTVFAGIVLIYNIMIISTRERAGEYATLKLLGISMDELRKMLFVETTVYAVFGFLFGMPVAYTIKYILENMFDSDDYTFIVTFSTEGYILAFALCICIIACTVYAVLRYIAQINPVDSLKERA